MCIRDRSKEDEEDYRYFPEPDLTPLIPTTEEIEAIDASLPVLPSAQRAALAQAAGIEVSDASLIVDRGDADFALAAIEAGADPARVVVHLDNNLADGVGQLTPESFAALIAMETGGELSATQTKEVLAEMVETGDAAADIAVAKGFEAMDSGELDGMLDSLIADHPDEWERYLSGDEGDQKKMAGFFTGQIMKATKGQADGKVINQLLGSRRD